MANFRVVMCIDKYYWMEMTFLFLEKRDQEYSSIVSAKNLTRIYRTHED